MTRQSHDPPSACPVGTPNSSRELPPKIEKATVAAPSGDMTRRGLLKAAAAAVGLGAIDTDGLFATMASDSDFRARFAICNETFGDWPLPKAFDFAAECGYEGVEIAPFTIATDVTEVSREKRREIRRQAESTGLTVVGLHWLLARTTGFHLTSPDRDLRNRTAVYLGALAEFCAELGGNLLVFGSPKQRDLASGMSYQRGLQYAAEVIHATMPVLEKTNVRLAMEPLSAGTTNFLRTASEAIELVRLVDSPRCQLILDCNAMKSETASRPDLIREFHSHLIHFHANDPNGQGPGFGDLDFIPIFKALRGTGYSDWISVEVFDYDPGPERLARESIQYLKRCVEATR